MDLISEPVDQRSSPEAKIALFRSLFRGREDVYPRRFESRKTGRSGYAPACANEWVRGVCEKPRIKCAECPNRRFLPITDDVVRWHLSGADAEGQPFVAGVYPLLQDETCFFLAVDFDKAGWREDVVPPHRDGGQSQYVSEVMHADASVGLAPLLEWARANLQRDLTIRELAGRAHMSERSFARHFRAATGTTPHQWLVHQRVIAAQRPLETTRDGIDRVAERVGLGTAATLRHHFQHLFHTSPLAYRKRFTTLSK